MKKLLTILALAGSVTLGYSQGTVAFGSLNAAFAISTNNPNPGGTFGKTATASGGYYYALLTQTYTGAASTTIGTNPLNTWSFAATATNSTILAGAVSGGSPAIAGWVPGTTEYVEVVGWSASLGTTWAQVLGELQSGTWSANGYYGTSAVGYIASGGVVTGGQASPAAPLFTPTGIPSGFDLNYVTSVPEPTTVALIGLGGLGLAMIRRRK